MSQKKPFGDRIYDILKDTVQFESSDWALARVERVSTRLQSEKSIDERLIVEVPWLEEFSAFTAPGRYIFFSRRLFEMCRDDEMAALVIAHEIAHHDLGHVNTIPDWLSRTAGEDLGIVLSGLWKLAWTRLYSPEQECEADRQGLQLCIRSGYDAQRCLAIFDVLEKHALDVGDVEMALGPDESDDELADDAPLLTRMRIWAYHRKRGYLPIRDRRKMLQDFLGGNA